MPQPGTASGAVSSHSRHQLTSSITYQPPKNQSSTRFDGQPNEEENFVGCGATGDQMKSKPVTGARKETRLCQLCQHRPWSPKQVKQKVEPWDYNLLLLHAPSPLSTSTHEHDCHWYGHGHGRVQKGVLSMKQHSKYVSPLHWNWHWRWNWRWNW